MGRGKRVAVVVEDVESEAITVTRADLYYGACVRDPPCEAHRNTVDKMFNRLRKKTT